MFPIRDTLPTRTFPVVNTLLILVNVLLFLAEMAQGPGLGRFLILYGLIPARYTDPAIAANFPLSSQVFSFVSFMFLHGGFWHLLGNMWSLWIFGDNVEDRLGPVRYLVFYLLCGWASGFAHILFNWTSEIPTIGASGAVAGVMGAYFLLHPRSRILTLILIIFIPVFVEIPAFFFLGVWFLFQFLSAAGSQGQIAGVAFWAHVGGFLFGMILLRFMTRVPAGPVQGRLKEMARKRTSPRLQVVRSTGPGGAPDLHGRLVVTRREADFGARKLVNIPLGFERRLFTVVVPPGVRDGQVLRLGGAGKRGPSGRGDVYLTVSVMPD